MKVVCGPTVFFTSHPKLVNFKIIKKRYTQMRLSIPVEKKLNLEIVRKIR